MVRFTDDLFLELAEHIDEQLPFATGTTVSGTFHLKKSETNSRELDVEIHYTVSHTGLTSSAMKFQTYKVR